MIAALAERLLEARFRTLSGAAQRALLLSLLANLSVAVAGPAGTRLPEPAAASEGHLLFSGRRTRDARAAAFWNAATMHARTQDDFHPIGNLHVGTVVIPVALAGAEQSDASGESLLDALIRGYTAAAALSRSVSAHTTPRGLRSTGLYSPFGATTTAASLRAHDARRLGNALALTASMASGTTQCWVDGSDEWQLHVARAADAGMLAVELTDHGVRGGSHQLDGPAGFFHALAGFVPSTEAIIADADPEAAILETVLKRYPVSGICQPVVLAAERLAHRVGRDPAKVRKLTVAMTPFEMRYPGTLNKGPFRSFSDVLMSAAFCAASVLEQGRLVFEDLNRFESPSRDALIARTEVVPDDALGTLSCRVTISLDDGTEYVEAVHDGGKALALDWTTVDDWAEALWEEGGRPRANYARTRDTVLSLADRPGRDLIAALAVG
ncbi:MAG: MmgE/PrpD family protein [Casimicrobiaceae bacterium]